MIQHKSLTAFYADKFDGTPALPPFGAGDFNVFALSDTRREASPASYTRYDFYKIMLIRGRHHCHYAHKSIELDGSSLLFFTPEIPYRFERIDKDATGYFLLFKKPFYQQGNRDESRELELFREDGRTSYKLNPTQDREVGSMFLNMIREAGSEYRFRYDLLRNIVSALIHFAMKLQPGEKIYPHPDGNARISSIFLQLLDRQFPLQSPADSIALRFANDFAVKLSVHVNHLNRALKSSTGKTTTAHISERLLSEATALLKHSHWDIAEISASLGFSQPAHFTSFFRKHTGHTPTAFRMFEFR